MKKLIYLVLLFLLGIHIFILSNLQFTAWPEMFSFPYMIDNGFLIYKDFHHVYQPLLTYTLLGVYKIFGFNLFSLKLFTYLLIAATDLMIFLNLKKVTKKNGLSILVLAVYIVLQPIFDGNMLWFDVAVTLPILLSIYFVDSNLFLTGFFIAISFLIKQQSVLLGIPIFVYILVRKTNFRKILKFFYGCITPVLILFVFLSVFRIFPDYIFWTFKFPLFHLPKIPGYSINPATHEIRIMLVLITTLFLGVVLNYKKLKPRFYLFLAILFFLILSAFPRFSLFHLQPALAVFVLLLGYLLGLKNKWFILFIIPALYLGRHVFINPVKETRFYGANEKKFAQEIKNISGNKKTYLLGPNSVEYVLSETIPPKPWIENYVWHFEIPGMQEKVIKGWENDPPAYIYWTDPEPGDWYELGTYQPDKIIKYINERYEKIDNINETQVWQLKNR